MARPGMHSETIENLREACSGDTPKLNGKDLSFALSLISQFDRYGKLSDKQMPWVNTLLERANDSSGTLGTMRPQDAKYPTLELGSMEGIQKLFDRVRAQHIDFPLIKFEHDGIRIRLSQQLHGNPINIKRDADKTWLGAVTPDGRFSFNRHMPQSMGKFLCEMAANPSQALGVAGKAQSYCCFCSTKLTSPDSKFYGYGPICAGKWGLDWGDAKQRMLEGEDKTLDLISEFIKEKSA